MPRAGASTEPPRERLVSPAVPSLALGLALIGLAVAAYLTVDHYRGVAPVCPDSGIVNCVRVTTSAESVLFGIPVAVYGLVFFAAMLLLDLPALWRRPDRRLLALRQAAAVVGMGFVLYLVSIELFVVGAICLWCTSVHVITFLLLLVITAGTTEAWPAVAAEREGKPERAEPAAGGRPRNERLSGPSAEAGGRLTPPGGRAGSGAPTR